MGTALTSASQLAGLLAACAALAALARVALALVRQAQRKRGLRDIPLAPGGVPVLGHLFCLIKHPLPWEQMLAWCDGCKSDIVRWSLPSEDWVVVRGAEAMRAVLQTKFRDFNKEVAMSFHPFLCILGSGLVTSHGQLWQQQRKLMTPAFKGDILQEVVQISIRATQRLFTKLDGCQKSGDTCEIELELRLLTLQVITEALMSLHHEESDRVFPTLYLSIMEECHKRVFSRWREFNPLQRAWWQHRSRTRQLDTYICGVILARWRELAARPSMAESEYRDLLDLILHGKMRAGEAWSAALQTQLCYELKTFLLAGHETSAAMLTYTLLELIAGSSELRDRVLAEADAALGTDGSQVPTRQAVEAMVWTEACLKETLRKYSVVPVVTRVAHRASALCGYAIPRGTKVVLHFQGTHRQWREPATYRPERFLPGGEFESFPEDIRRFMFVAFGQGPRVCIGQHFSLMESRVVLAALLQRYAFDLQRPYELQWCHNIIPLQPRGGVPIGVHSRRRANGAA